MPEQSLHPLPLDLHFIYITFTYKYVHSSQRRSFEENCIAVCSLSNYFCCKKPEEKKLFLNVLHKYIYQSASLPVFIANCYCSMYLFIKRQDMVLNSELMLAHSWEIVALLDRLGLTAYSYRWRSS
jgi:hypothetical protein